MFKLQSIIHLPQLTVQSFISGEALMQRPSFLRCTRQFLIRSQYSYTFAILRKTNAHLIRYNITRRSRGIPRFEAGYSVNCPLNATHHPLQAHQAESFESDGRLITLSTKAQRECDQHTKMTNRQVHRWMFGGACYIPKSNRVLRRRED